MTSQLNVDAIVDKAGSGGTNVKVANTSTYVSDGGAVTQNTVQGMAKAWLHVPVAGSSILDSFNVSSHDDDGSGDGGVHISNNMSNNNYAITSMASDAGASTVITTLELTQNTEATGSFDYETAFANSSTNRTNHDANRMMTIHGDLA